jgi:magnesium chelatase family protein
VSPLPSAEPLLLAEEDTPPDLRDIKGQAAAKRALEVAAGGGHSLLMVGPPGSGKSMLAQRLPGLLPSMSEDEVLASAALQGLAARSFDTKLGRRSVRSAPYSQRRRAGGRWPPPRPGGGGQASIDANHLGEAMQLRRELPER